MEINYYHTSASRSFFENLTTDRHIIASSSIDKIQNILNEISFHSQQLRYSPDIQDKKYTRKGKDAKHLINLRAPLLEARKPKISLTKEESAKLEKKLKVFDLILNNCLRSSDRETIIDRMFEELYIDELLILAKNGNNFAQHILYANAFYKGIECSDAVLIKAADQGNANALFLLATIQNDNFNLMIEAAKLGHREAQIALIPHGMIDLNDLLKHLMKVYKDGDHGDDLLSYVGNIFETWDDSEHALKWYSKISNEDTRNQLIQHIINQCPWDLC